MVLPQPPPLASGSLRWTATVAKRATCDKKIFGFMRSWKQNILLNLIYFWCYLLCVVYFELDYNDRNRVKCGYLLRRGYLRVTVQYRHQNGLHQFGPLPLIGTYGSPQDHQGNCLLARSIVFLSGLCAQAYPFLQDCPRWRMEKAFWIMPKHENSNSVQGV